MGDRLHKGEKLEVGQSLTSDNGAYKATLQDDGNFVLYSGDQAIWSTETNGQAVVRAEVQEDGNFVLYTADKPVWHSDTKGAKDVRLVLQNDRNLVLYGFDGPAWSSGTNTDEAPPAAAEPEVELAAAEEAPAPVVEEAPAPPPPPPAPAVQTYTVVSGDTLWAISERYYGDGNRYQEIANASGIDNPDLIHPGQVLTIP
ncbi:LysM peptidoglycan-binding domain-containing protein [Mycolicibacterium sp. P9-64]|uniref:LysM peptidoglycan-binding domain-containing protein n=1 Tax=Mycolicibacterium sp. P9-64 TaxID=2024612 RepID=UPI0011EF0250|nr:LysM peptidoglycan-binding domain-containing protein [Mycolicibacterium sp. P9-64]KAA0074195.1 LysM peptidoglycan-binding domain-containing protein [Mycolicibacterium sp. P9-64]